ncbi:ETX/MTX2 family pore-forming toxin [Bacillus cereus group sp. Bc222]|uniref:ETX/MTX2 family pore-forming toxin n=1 Tax=Bacillus cereus group sp. Bc222 TaxID=3018111 RepID=UPI0022E0E808|nr:ETX/MTX2 family pore-forming toxin [Bacillus cereus group sp. Bc222]MDA2241153.1 ETX/MTX2 family pore-forming toxin [Bacillus cereus group sp. Bc222]
MKKPMVALMLAISIGIPCISVPGSALAAENTPTSVNENVRVGITDVQSELKKIGEYHYTNNIAGTKIESWPTLTFKKKPDSVDTKINFSITGKENKLNFDSSIVEYIGENVFPNPFDEPVERTTSKYSKAVTESTTTTTIKGFKVGGSGDGSNIFTIPLLLNNGIKVNAEFNSSTSESKTKSETKTVEASPQKIIVPPHKTYKADVILEQRNYWGDVTFTGVGSNPVTTIKGTASYWAPNGMGAWKQYTFSDKTENYWKGLSTSQKNSVNGIKFENNNVKAEGAARVEGIFGSLLTVNVYDITDKSNPKLVETRSFK